MGANDRDAGYPATPGMAEAVRRLQGGYARHEEGMDAHRRKLEEDARLRSLGRLMVEANRQGRVERSRTGIMVTMDGDAAAAAKRLLDGGDE